MGQETAGSGDVGGKGEEGEEGKSDGRKIEEDTAGGRGLSMPQWVTVPSQSANSCAPSAARRWKREVVTSVGERGRGGEKV